MADFDSLKTDSEKLAFHARQAEEAYSRMYDAHSKTEAAAAYSDCKESLSLAIGLAKTLGLKEQMRELEGKLEHYKAVYRSQFS